MNRFIRAISCYLLILCSIGAAVSKECRIIFTANINGALENCQCGTDPLGGLGRIKTLLDQYRRQFPDAIIIDGGDFFNSYPHKRLNEAMLAGLKNIPYDIMVPGDQEFTEGNSFYAALEHQFRGKILISNSTKQNSLQIKRDSYLVLIRGYLSPAAFEFIDQPIWLKEPENTIIKSNYEKVLNILIYHGKLEASINLAGRMPETDLILLAHDQKKGIWEEGTTKIVGVGKDSEYVGMITAREANRKWELEIKHIPVKESIAEDPVVLEIIREYHKSD